jgi:hypothetical protein
MKKMSRWELTEEVRLKYTPVVEEFIKQVELSKYSDGENRLEKDFSDTELNPYTLVKLLETLGYEEIDQDSNGWQLDFWITMKKDRHKSLYVLGTGMTFELKLVEK